MSCPVLPIKDFTVFLLCWGVKDGSETLILCGEGSSGRARGPSAVSNHPGCICTAPSLCCNKSELSVKLCYTGFSHEIHVICEGFLLSWLVCLPVLKYLGGMLIETFPSSDFELFYIEKIK